MKVAKTFALFCSAFNSINCSVTWKIGHPNVDFSCTGLDAHKSHYETVGSMWPHLKNVPPVV